MNDMKVLKCFCSRKGRVVKGGIVVLLERVFRRFCPRKGRVVKVAGSRYDDGIILFLSPQEARSKSRVRPMVSGNLERFCPRKGRVVKEARYCGLNDLLEQIKYTCE